MLEQVVDLEDQLPFFKMVASATLEYLFCLLFRLNDVCNMTFNRGLLS